MPAAVPDDRDEWCVGPRVERVELVKDVVEFIRREFAKLVVLPEKIVELDKVLEETELQTPAEQIPRPLSLGAEHTAPQAPQLIGSVRREAHVSPQFVHPDGHDFCEDFDLGEAVGLADELVDVLFTGVLEVDGEAVVAAVTPVEATAGTLVVSAEGGMTPKLTLALHSARVVPSGQQPLFVQYCPSGQ